MPITIPDNLPYTPRGIECLRLGARRGGEGIGCCAIDIMQGFSNDPDAICPKTPQFNGDTWFPEMYEDGDHQLCVGGEGITNEQAFLAYLVHGSFSPHETYPDHGFIVSLTKAQVYSAAGKKWLAILKREGFQWVGSVSNSVYSEFHPNYVFMLLRNTRNHMSENELESLNQPPSFWEALPTPGTTPEERFEELAQKVSLAHTPAD